MSERSVRDRVYDVVADYQFAGLPGGDAERSSFRAALDGGTRVPDVEPAGEVVGSGKEADLGYDSLDLVELIQDLEEEFAVSIPDQAWENLRTLDDMVRMMERLSATAA